MQRNYSTLLSLTLSTLIFTGCSITHKNIDKLQTTKQSQLKDNIYIINDETKFKGYMDENNRLKYLCYKGDSKSCNYYDYKKHGHIGQVPKEEIFWINKEGFYPNILANTNDVQCGAGTMLGWLVILPLGEKATFTNYNNITPHVCNYRYTKVDSKQIGFRAAVGLLTFMTPFLTAGNMHTRMFDEKSFIDSIHISNIDSFRDQLFKLRSKYDLTGGIDVVYIDKDSVENDLKDKYEELLDSKSLKSGVIFLQKDTNRLLGVTIFDKYKKKDLLSSISMQITDLLNSVSKNKQYSVNYDEVISLIPKEIELPKIPKIEKLVKDEFEKQSKFENRVKVAITNRENKIKKLQKDYSNEVQKRNNYIKKLQKEYKYYLNDLQTNKKEFLKELTSNIPLLSKVLFLENVSGYDANNFKYDAQLEKLYFNIYSKKREFTQQVVAKIPPKSAKIIKENKTFKIIPNIELNNNILKLKSFNLLETTNNDYFDATYTNINFKPQSTKITITTLNEHIDKKVSNLFTKLIQKEEKIVDTHKKEIWYIDIVKRVDGKVPEWFMKPNNTKNIIGYGEADTIEEAKLNARKDLVQMINVKINTTSKNIKEVNNFKKYHSIKSTINQVSNVELNSKDYTVYKQERLDGRWYVGYVLLNL